MSATVTREQDRKRAAGAVRLLRVARLKPGEARPHFDEFEVTVDAHTTVLDALRDIRLHHDRSLTLRYSCCHASCGTCGMRVNGKEVLACVTTVAALPPGPVVIEPLANAPVERDLVVDMRGFYEHLQPAQRPLLRRSEPDGADVAATGEGEPFVRFEDCIECGLCVSACPIAGTDPRYAGPAGLAAAWRMVEEPRGTDPAQVLAWADDEQGCWRCHASFECTAACPSGADPAGAIMRLRRELATRKLRQLTSHGGRRRQ